MDETEVDGRIAYGGHWWMKDDEDLILIYDEATRQWDLWGGEPGDPLPPPELLPEGAAVTGALPQWRFYLASKILFWVFVAAAVVHAAIALLFLLKGPSRMEDSTYELIADIYSLTSVFWQLTLAALVILTVLNINRYIEERRFEAD